MYLYGSDFEKATELSKLLFFSEYTNSFKNYAFMVKKKNRPKRSYNSSKVTYLLNVY